MRFEKTYGTQFKLHRAIKTIQRLLLPPTTAAGAVQVTGNIIALNVRWLSCI